MTAASEGRNTKRRNADRVSLLVDSGVTVFAGTLIAVLTATGEAVPAGTANSSAAVGVAETTVTGDGTERVEVTRGCFQFANSASTDEIKAGDIGSDCYVADDQTVAKTDGSSTRKKAGKVIDVDSAGVWVLVG